ncbi:MAG: GTP-binding protein [Symploca sp. SIO3E6]|nr:GTP-binding protein [Caldora sp. SIO3E6]
MTSIISRKICLLGDFSVGKTSLIRRFVERQFSDKYLSTVGVKISRKTVNLKSRSHQNSMSIQMMIWDLEGNTKFKAITPTYMQGARSAVIVGDLTRKATIEHIPDHIQSFLSVNSKGFIIVALNKSDLIAQDELAEISNFPRFNSHDQVIGTYLTSAKTGVSVDQVFSKLAFKMIQL